MRAIDKVPSRIKYYLLDWKDKNMTTFLKEFGMVRLNDLDNHQLFKLFNKVILEDQSAIIYHSDKPIPPKNKVSNDTVSLIKAEIELLIEAVHLKYDMMISVSEDVGGLSGKFDKLLKAFLNDYKFIMDYLRKLKL